jgi:two-component system, chemotaxis family, CheB/CheR fusion protein
VNADEVESKLEPLLDYLKRNRGFDFRGYKRPSLMRRIQHRMQSVTVADFAEYVDYLEVHPEEFAQLFNTILINVTTFFRDEPGWGFVRENVLPRILANKREGDPIRVWSAGCASGEETYSLAILFAEALGAEAFRQRVKIYATDVDEDALNQARQAAYTDKDLRTVAAELRQRYFEANGDRYVFRPDLRRSIVFGRHDLFQDAPISRLDLLVCRNTLIYFNAEAQHRILARFHFALNEDAYLFLGKAEMLLTHANLFSPVDLRHRIFLKVSRVNGREGLLGLAQAGHTEGMNHLVSRHARLRDLSLETSPVATLVVDFGGTLLMVNDRACGLFGLTPKDVGRPFQDVECSYRPVDLRSLMEQAYAEHRTIRLSNLERHLPADETQYLDVQVTPLYDNGSAPLGASISFSDVTGMRRLHDQLNRSNQELETTLEELQSAHEELETTNEELQSTNEELETTNEELQSTNEELETMNEELQSTNEELETMNEELRQRTGDLNQSNSFLRCILSSLQVGVAVLDEQLNVLVWNPRAADLWGLQTTEVEGKSLLRLDMGLPVEKLPLRDFLVGKAEDQTVMLDAINRRGRQIQCEVSITHFRDEHGQRQGIVLLMEDVTERLKMVGALGSSDERFRVALLHTPIAVSMQDQDLRYTWAYNPILGHAVDAMMGKCDTELFLPEDAARLMDIKRRVLQQGAGMREEIELAADGHPRRYDVVVEPLYSENGAIIGVTCAAMELVRRPDGKKVS